MPTPGLHRRLLMTLTLLLLPHGAVAQIAPAPPPRDRTAGVADGAAEEAARVHHLLSRATWGVRAGDIEAVLDAGRDTWLDRQLAPAAIPDDALTARLHAFPTLAMGMGELYRDFSPRPADAVAPQELTPEQRRERQARSPARLLNELVAARIQRAVYTERQLEDVMTDFWFNHFNVFFNKGQVRYLLADYERTAIRAHVFGRFEDMLLATAQHPAMLFYLDNWQSVHMGPVAQRMAGERMQRGRNENYARELLELHTLGVDGGYTQQDVVEVARAFTGWSFQPYNVRQPQQPQQPQRPLAAALRAGREQVVMGEGDVPFVFRPQLHDTGEKVVLGTRLPAGRGMDDGLDVINMLARHPSTARHIATKLVQRFVADDPPAGLVDELAAVFLDTDGDLRAVTRALFRADAFYRAEFRGTMVKTPFEVVASALRVGAAEVRPSQRILATLRTMGHVPYTEPAPTGFPTTSEDWVNTGAMLNRMNFALELAAGRVDGVRIDMARMLERRDVGAGVLPLDGMLAAVLPGVDTARLAGRIREDMMAESITAPRQQAARALGLALGSPEFQRR